MSTTSELTALLSAGRAAYPEVTVSAHDLRAHVARVTTAPRSGALSADLYLAAACAHGDAAALSLLEHRFLAAVPRHLSKLRLSGVLADEAAEKVREKLLVGGDAGLAALHG